MILPKGGHHHAPKFSRYGASLLNPKCVRVSL